MEDIYENIRKYGEEMEGKFSHKPHGNGIVISVTSPFVAEITIECDPHISNAYSQPYLLLHPSLLDPQAEHPEITPLTIYYNTRDTCYYKCEYRRESESGYVWVKTTKDFIIEHARDYQRLQAHFHMYENIHKGQLCKFTAYAIDPNGYFKRPTTVESRFDTHEWFYYPWSFEVSLFNGDTIDDFADATPISKEMTDKMVLYHKKQREDERRGKRKEFCQNFKDKLSKFAQFFDKYPTFFMTVIGMIVGAIITALITVYLGK